MANQLAQNMATAQRARERRQRAVAEGQMSPREAAMSAYGGPGWDAFFGSFQDQEEAGYTPRVDWSGFGNTEGSGMPRRTGNLALNPLEERDEIDRLRSHTASLAVDEAKREMAAQKAYTDDLQQQAIGSLRGAYDEQQTARALETEALTPADRERQLRTAPVQMRPVLLKHYADIDAKAAANEAAMVKARADETTAQAALEKVRNPAEAKPTYEWANVEGKNQYLTPDEIRAKGGTKPMTATEALDERKYKKADPVLRGISELSEKINTQQGLLAKMSGGASRVAAKANYDDDVAEYTALVSGFTPMVARALGHTGVLTQQDVDSVKALFPLPGDSKTLRDRKMARVKGIIGDLEEATSSPAGAGGTKISDDKPADLVWDGAKFVKPGGN